MYAFTASETQPTDANESAEHKGKAKNVYARTPEPGKDEPGDDGPDDEACGQRDVDVKRFYLLEAGRLQKDNGIAEKGVSVEDL